MLRLKKKTRYNSDESKLILKDIVEENVKKYKVSYMTNERITVFKLRGYFIDDISLI